MYKFKLAKHDIASKTEKLKINTQKFIRLISIQSSLIHEKLNYHRSRSASNKGMSNISIFEGGSGDGSGNGSRNAFSGQCYIISIG